MAKAEPVRRFRWVPFAGQFVFPKDNALANTLVFKGGEIDPPPSTQDQSPPEAPNSLMPSKGVLSGKILSDQYFKEGRIKAQITFAAPEPDFRSFADIVIQYDPDNDDMLSASIGGFGSTGGPPLVSLRVWSRTNKDANLQPQQGAVPKAWRTISSAGHRIALQHGRPYDLEVVVRGSLVTILLDGVVLVRRVLEFPLPGHQVGLFCSSARDITFRNFTIAPVRPRAFVVMQYNTPAYEHVFEHVIKPLCDDDEIGLEAYRADLECTPGIVLEDVQRKIQESYVVIAEITPLNGSVYYEVGYADALQKPVVLMG
mgnify:CR=1 FL=1